MVSNKIIKKVPRKSKRYYKENKERLQKKVRYWYEGLSQEKKIRKENMLQINIGRWICHIWRRDISEEYKQKLNERSKSQIWSYFQSQFNDA